MERSEKLKSPDTPSQGLPLGPKRAVPVTGTFLGPEERRLESGGRLNAYGKPVSSTGQESKT